MHAARVHAFPHAQESEGSNPGCDNQGFGPHRRYGEGQTHIFWRMSGRKMFDLKGRTGAFFHFLMNYITLGKQVVLAYPGTLEKYRSKLRKLRLGSLGSRNCFI